MNNQLTNEALTNDEKVYSKTQKHNSIHWDSFATQNKKYILCKNQINTDENKIYDKIFNSVSVNSKQLTSSNDLQNLHKSDIDAVQSHTISYSSLLQNYTKHIDDTLKFKRFAKKVFFWIVTVTLVMSMVSFIGTICYIYFGIIRSDKELTDYLVTIVTSLSASLGAFISSIIVIPKIVAKYLFNRDEENNISTIVSNMQQYDKDIRDRL